MKKQLILIFLLLNTCLLFSQSWDLYVSDAGKNQVVKYDQNGENSEVFIEPSSGGLNWPQDILFMEDKGTVLVSGLFSNAILEYDAETGDFIRIWADGLDGPTRMKIGRDGYLYVLQWGFNQRVKRYDLDGNFIDDFTQTGMDRAIGLTWDLAGNLYVSSFSSRQIKKYGLNGEDLGIFISRNLSGPTNIWFDSNAEMLVCDYTNSAIKRFSATGNYLGRHSSQVNMPEGLVHLDNGDLMVGNAGDGSIRLLDADGVFKKIVTQGGVLLTPNALRRRGRMSAVSDLIKQQNVFYPSIGDVFYVQKDFAEKIKKVEVINFTGSVIKSFGSLAESSLDLTDLPEGIYQLIVMREDNQIINQQVIVQH